MAPFVVVLDRSLSMAVNGLFWDAQIGAIDTIEGLGTPGSADHLLATVEFGARPSVVALGSCQGSKGTTNTGPISHGPSISAWPD
jgi:hypothetical protein